METQTQNQTPVTPTSQSDQVTMERMIQEIYDNTVKTKNYMKWQLIITVALIVIPLLATIFVIPFAMKSLSTIYGVSVGGGDTLESLDKIQNIQNSDQFKDLLK
jgi:hypothetical protein